MEEPNSVQEDCPSTPVLGYRCLADELWSPFYAIVQNPRVVAISFFSSYTIVYIIWSIFLLLWQLVGFVGILVICVLLVKGLGYSAALILAFPGCLKLVTREIELSCGRAMKKKLEAFITEMDKFCGALKSPRAYENRKFQILHHYGEYQNLHASFFKPFERAFTMLSEKEQLQPAAGEMYDAVKVVNNALTELEPQVQSLLQSTTSEFEEKRMDLLVNKGNLSFKNLCSGMQKLMKLLPTMTNPPKEASGIRWLIESILDARKPLNVVITLDFMRADLLVRYNGEQFWMNGSDNQSIDCVLVPPYEVPQDATDDEASIDAAAESEQSVVILCNPNAGLYEYHHLQSDWIEFYRARGNHVLLFNYRGYGRNRGFPSPERNNRDGEELVEYLASVKKFPRIAVHGESIGGMVATHLGRYCPRVDLIVADRTFASLPAVGQRLIANWVAPALKFCTMWYTDNVTNYLEAKCNKIVCSDPNDEVVAHASSLKAGIALRVALGKDTTIVPVCDKVTCRKVKNFPDDNPLTEQVIKKFYESLLSIASRAAEDATPEESTAIEDALPASDDIDVIVVPIIDHQNRVDQNDLRKLWTILQGLDDGCGEHLGEAMQRGIEGISIWLASLVVWVGTRGKSSYWTSLSRNFQGSVAEDPAISYVYNTLQLIAREVPSKESKVLKTSEVVLDFGRSSTVGNLIPLSCGHNRNPNNEEKQLLTKYLRAYGWAPSYYGRLKSGAT